ncbi:MAG: hypothetical protein QF479_06820 [Candidatus Poseidoniaceae archaeon]|nr:hypothetical protein [Candidatus Poseidoniaceae archaeon]
MFANLDNGVLWSILGNLIGLVFCGGYAVYTFLRQGTHVRGIGWKSKTDYPKSYYFTLGIMIIISLFSLASIIFRLYTYYNR